MEEHVFKILKSSMASMMLICFREGMMHADHGWVQTRKNSGVDAYRENTDEVSTLEGFIQAMKENLESSIPHSFEVGYGAALKLAMEKLDQEKNDKK